MKITRIFLPTWEQFLAETGGINFIDFCLSHGIQYNVDDWKTLFIPIEYGGTSLWANVNNYRPAKDGGIADRTLGCAFESSVTGMRAKEEGKRDWKHHGTHYEIKTGAGIVQGLKHGNKLHILYVPVVRPESNGLVIPERQEGFYFSNPHTFLDAMDTAKLVRERATEDGIITKLSIQTFWNHKQQKSNGQGLYKWLDALYQFCDCTLEEFYEQGI